MTDKINIELDDSFLKKFFELTNSDVPSIDDINLAVLKKQLYDVETYLNELKSKTPLVDKKSVQNDLNEDLNMQDSDSLALQNSDGEQMSVPMNYNQPTIQFIEPESIKRDKKQYYDDNGHPVKGKVLIIDDLGIITYQLSVIFKRAGYLPVTAKEIYDAVDKYKRSSYDYVVMDLFIPTEREGFILLEELNKIAYSRKEEPVIAVMSASTRKEHKQTCQKKGAACYIEKVDDWQKELFEQLLKY